MLVCVAGDTHGELGRLYQIVDVLERQAGRAVDVVLQVGDFGVWPDPNRLDEATRLFEDLVFSEDCAEFLTLPAYPLL